MGNLTVIKPVNLVASTALADLGNAATPAAVPVGKERVVDVRASCEGAADAYVDLYLVDVATPANSVRRVRNYPVPYQSAGSAPDLERGLLIPAGFKLQVQASANAAVAISMTGHERDAEA